MPTRSPGAAQKILVADDDDLLSEVLVSALIAGGFSASSAPQGVVTSELASDADLVLLDAHVPGVDFAVALQALHDADVPVLVLSGELSPPPGVPMEHFLSKPLELRDLLAAVKRLTSPTTEP